MQEEGIIREIEISDGSKTHKASYFVEHGVLHASVGDKVVRLAVGAHASEEAVRRLLLGHIQTKAWRQRMAERWRGS